MYDVSSSVLMHLLWLSLYYLLLLLESYPKSIRHANNSKLFTGLQLNSVECLLTLLYSTGSFIGLGKRNHGREPEWDLTNLL